MFSTTVRAALLALAATASVVSAAPGLSLKVTGADAVDGVENFKVVATLTNTGDETLKLLNDPRGSPYVGRLHDGSSSTKRVRVGPRCIRVASAARPVRT